MALNRGYSGYIRGDLRGLGKRGPSLGVQGWGPLLAVQGLGHRALGLLKYKCGYMNDNLGIIWVIIQAPVIVEALGVHDRV